MHAVDTNILVRLSTKDDVTQAKRAHDLFSKGAVFISKTVLLETEWVLRYVYALEQSTILHALRGILGLPNVDVEDPLVVSQSLDWVEKGLDFADALHVASSQDAQKISTFDAALQKKARSIMAMTVELF